MTTKNGTHYCQPNTNESSDHDQSKLANNTIPATDDMTAVTSRKADADEIRFERLTIDEQGLLLFAKTLNQFKLNAGTKVRMVVKNEQVLISSDGLTQSILHAAEELQLRQDEENEDFSDGIRTLVRNAYQTAS